MQEQNDPAVFRGARDPRPPTISETLQLFSHDIRSAMSDVIGGLRLIDLCALDPDTRLQVDRIQAAGDTLAELVDGALMAAAGETLIQSDARRVCLQAWLGSTSDRWTGHARARGLSFTMDVADTLPDGLRVTQVSLDRIVGNLVGNAMTHAGGQPVRLTIRASEGDGLSVTVSDAGPGYPVAVLNQMDAAGAVTSMGQHPRNGLGLRIAAELSRQIGGHLSLENAEGGGGIATLHLPVDALDWEGDPGAGGQMPDLSSLRVLVAEDNLTNQTILRQLLGTMGAHTVFVADGIAAVEMMEAESFDIALIDIEMPRLSGLEVMRRIRARDDAKAELPLVALTAYVLRDNREAIYAAGADGIIGKPVSSAREFGVAVLRHAGWAPDLPDADQVLSGETEDVGLGCKLDHERFEALMQVAGPDGRAELLARLGEDLDRVGKVLDRAVAEPDVPEIRAQTHILIAISGAVGADRLHRLAEVLNVAAKRERVDDLTGVYAPMSQELTDLIAVVRDRADAEPGD